MHPHVPQTWLTQSERDANTIENLRVLVRQLEARLKASSDRVYELELLLGVDRRALADENQRLRQALRDANQEIDRLAR